MRNTADFVLLVVHLCFIAQVSGLNLDKAKRAALGPEKLGVSKTVNCNKIKCPSKELVCVKLRSNIQYSPMNVLTMVMNRCEFEYMQCNEGMEAIELPMKYCRYEQALQNEKNRSNRRFKRSPEIAPKTTNNNIASQNLRKRSENKKPKINYRSLYFGPKSRKDADAEDPAEVGGEESPNSNKEIDDLIYLSIQPNNANKEVEVSKSAETGNGNRDVQISNDDGKDSKESANRNQEVGPENGEGDEKNIQLTIQTNNANRDVEISKSAEAEKADRDVQISNDNGEPSKESGNRNQKIDPENGEGDEKNIQLTIQTNNANRGVEISKSGEAEKADRDVQISNDDGEPSKESGNRNQEIDPENGEGDKKEIELTIQTNNANRDVEVSKSTEAEKADRDVQISNNEEPDKESANRDQELEGVDDDDQRQKISLIIETNRDAEVADDNNDETIQALDDKENEADADPEGNDEENAEDNNDDQNARAEAAPEDAEEENEIDGENENAGKLKDDLDENDEDGKNTKVVIESSAANIDVVIGNNKDGETVDEQEENPEKPNRLDENSDGEGDPMADEDGSSIEGKNGPDYEDVNIDEYKSDCPSVCPARDVMVCARCKEGVYRTFMSVCHLRMFNCKHPEEKLELVGRRPCMMSAPFLNDMPKAQGRVGEPGDSDRIFEYLRCKGKAALKDPKCRGRATNDEAQKRRHKI